MFSRNIFKVYFLCTSPKKKKKKGSSCRLLLLFSLCSLEVTQKQGSLPTQSSDGHKKGEMELTNTAFE